MRLIAVVPAYNEARTVGRLVREMASSVDEVIVVDDGSPDATAAQAAAAGAFVVRHHLNRGQGAALRTGTEMALERGAELIVHIDADGQHDPAALAELTAPLRQGRADIVFGSRFMGLRAEGMPPARRWLLAGVRVFNFVFLGIPLSLTDPQSGLRAMTAEVASQIDFRQDRMAHCSEILQLACRGDWRLVEVPVRVLYSSESLAKGQRATDAFKIVWQLVLGMFRR